MNMVWQVLCFITLLLIVINQIREFYIWFTEKEEPLVKAKFNKFRIHTDEDLEKVRIMLGVEKTKVSEIVKNEVSEIVKNDVSEIENLDKKL